MLTDPQPNAARPLNQPAFTEIEIVFQQWHLYCVKRWHLVFLGHDYYMMPGLGLAITMYHQVQHRIFCHTDLILYDLQREAELYTLLRSRPVQNIEIEM